MQQGNVGASNRQASISAAVRDWPDEDEASLADASSPVRDDLLRGPGQGIMDAPLGYSNDRVEEFGDAGGSPTGSYASANLVGDDFGGDEWGNEGYSSPMSEGVGDGKIQDLQCHQRAEEEQGGETERDGLSENEDIGQGGSRIRDRGATASADWLDHPGMFH